MVVGKEGVMRTGPETDNGTRLAERISLVEAWLDAEPAAPNTLVGY